jgi:hypothetical protein
VQKLPVLVKIFSSMKRVILLIFLALAISISAEAAKLKDEIKGVWSVVKVETTDQTLNTIIQESDLSKLLVEFAKSGAVLISGNDTKTKYSVNGDKIIFSDGVTKEISNSEIKANIQSNILTANLSPEMVKQIMLIAKDLYIKSGGEVFIGKMIENAAKTSSIEAVITLKRK